LAGTYPLKRYGVVRWMLLIKCKNIMSLFLDQLIADYNQIFTRDIGFVIDGILLNRIFFLSVKRTRCQYVIDQIDAMK
jgi:hypothetical protein